MSKISEVFNKDPLAWTTEDRDLAVEYYKAHRHMFKELKKPKTKKARVQAIKQLEFDLDAEEGKEKR